ncbi:restriction endonuclease [Nonlabens sp. SCSIO 43208]|uniref:hypothetical protein n=1 Tax=Nonlabens sp. SCSIO 43208 TaxID=2793009 RepID=UPI003D6A8146
MKSSEFAILLRNAQHKLLENGKKVYFDDGNYSEEQFINFLEEDLKYRGDYKLESIYSFDEKEFSISLNSKVNADYFVKNKIEKTIKNSNYALFEELSILFMYKMLSSLIVPEFKASRDEGIDFYGKFLSKDDSDSGLFDISSWYIGQTKHYKFGSNIKTNAIRELIGTLELARMGKWSIEGNYRNIKIDYSDNVIPVFLTSSAYSKDSKRLAEHYGVKLLDSIDMSFWLTVVFKGNNKKMLKELKDLKANSKQKLSSIVTNN